VSTFDYDLKTRSRVLRKRQPVPNYDASLYVSERSFATARDGTLVPISLVYRKDRKAAAPQPLLLYGYGSYGIPIDPAFSQTRVSLLDRGVVFAIAHIRGGGDLGRTWYDAGKMANKQTTFDDFIACAEALIDGGRTTPSLLAIEGGSAGGLLMGAVVNQRPELFRATVAQVPFVDVVTTMLDETMPLTVGEFIEWGNPKIAEQYAWMRAYSPYDNLKPGAYPAMLVRTGLNDTQVAYWEPAKYVARLRTLKTDDRPLLLKINLEVGHGGASGRFDSLREIAEDDVFVLVELGVEA
jgi:oligopeptidase B